MKTVLWLLVLACCICGTMTAQMLTERSRVNPIGEAQARALASRMTIGMSEVDALGFLSTNGLNVNSTIHETNRWLRVFSYTNETSGCSAFWLEFRQKPTQPGIMMRDRLVAITNGVLEGAFLHNVQLARTNAP